jgi:hypothetical protein
MGRSRMAVAVPALALLALLASVAFAQQGADRPEDPHGTAVCAWRRYFAIDVLMDVCGRGTPEARSAMNDAVEKIEGFIVERNPDLRTQLEKVKMWTRWKIGTSHETVCHRVENELGEFELDSSGIVSLQESVRRLLDSPLKPGMNDCLQL